MDISVVFSNIRGFDGIIFIAAAANVIVFIKAKKAASALYEAMHREVYAPSCGADLKNIRSDMDRLTDKKVSAMRAKAVSKYTLFVNITGIFPLLGILGTVVSLLGMVGSDADVTNNFFAALTSTFWGLVCAIIFKFIDGFISPLLDDGERAAELFMNRRAEGHPAADTGSDILDIFRDSNDNSPEKEEEYETEK